VIYFNNMFLITDTSYIIKKIKGKGRGVCATRDIDAGTVIGDYLGTIVRPKDADEKKHGLYDMAGGDKYDILGDPRVPGIHLINHSCAENCEVYPYKGHILCFSLRKIFKGEELTVNYDLYAPDEKETTCDMHTCSCGSKICMGTMHRGLSPADAAWEKLKKKEFGPFYHNKIPGKYGTLLRPLKKYPHSIHDHANLYNVFGTETRPPARYADRTLPAIGELRKRIRKTGKQLALPKLHLQIYGVRNGVLIATRIK